MTKIKILIFSFSFLFFTSFSAQADIILLQPGDFVGTTFWITSMGMVAATVFLIIERGTVAASWRTPVTIAGVTTGVAFIHYVYMGGLWVQTR